MVSMRWIGGFAVGVGLLVLCSSISVANVEMAGTSLNGVVSSSQKAVSDSLEPWQINLGGRVQFQSYGTIDESREQVTQLGATVRRFRVKLFGALPSHNISFYTQPSFDRGEAGLELAYIDWNPWKKTEVTVGQFKVPATRQFMVSSGRLQLVDRSFADAEHRLLYDVGLMVRQRLSIGERSLVQMYGSATTGEGSERAPAEGGYSYTVRMEYLPLSDFDQYRISDLTRSNRLRISGAMAYNLNVDAVQTGGSIGKYMGGFQSDIGTVYADLLLKYNGWSLFSQGTLREAVPATDAPGFGDLNVINEGNTFVVQSGYMVSDKTEITGRFALYNPSKQVDYAIEGRRQYTVGATHFFRSDELKVQFDAGYIENTPVDHGHLIVRGQLQIDF